MESQIKLKNLLVWFLMLCFFALAFYEAMAFYTKYAVAMYYNSDAIQIPYFAHFLIYQHGSIESWYFPPTPYLFPDVFLTLIISLFSANITHVTFSYALLQSIIYTVILMALFQVVLKEKYAWRVGFFSAAVSILLLAKGYVAGELMPAMLVSNYHFGGTLMVYVCLGLFIYCFRKNRPWAHALLFVLLAISGLSDILVLFYFVFPICLTLFIYWIYRYFNFKVLLFYGVFLFAALGFSELLLYVLPLHIANSQLLIQLNLLQLDKMYIVLKANYEMMPIMMMIWLSYAFVAFGILNYRNYTIKKDDERNFFISFTLLYFLVVMIAGAFGLSAIDTGLKGAPPYTGLRHLQPFILGPLFIGWPLIIYLYFPKIKSIIKNGYMYGICLLLLFIALSIHFIKFDENGFFNYYPSSYACIDQHAKQYNLHAGVADYWLAKPFTAFSKNNIVIAAVNPGDPALSPAEWITTTSYFNHNNFDFIIVKDRIYDLSDKFLFAKLNRPNAQFTCEDYKIYVYKNGALNKMLKQSDSKG